MSDDRKGPNQPTLPPKGSRGQQPGAVSPKAAAGGGGPPVHLPTIGRFGRFDIVGRLAMGGMAEILLARETMQGAGTRHVVVKRILEQYAEQEEFVEMFFEEARIGMRVTHPNICHIYGFGEEGGSHYIAMEWVNGAPLGKVIRRARNVGGIPMSVTARIIAEVAEALDSAHRLVGEDGQPLRLIHRDVTPHNIMVTYDGKVKLLDFGIARADSRQHQTRAGVVKGKFAYMPPEQIEGRPIDHRVDIFALSVCLYEGLTGRTLYQRREDMETLRAIVDEPVPRLSDRVPSPPPQLEAVVKRGLAKRADDRFQTAQEMQDALEGFVAASGTVVNAGRISELMSQLFTEELRVGPTLDTTPFGSSYHVGNLEMPSLEPARDSRPSYPGRISDLDLPPVRRQPNTAPGTGDDPMSLPDPQDAAAAAMAAADLDLGPAIPRDSDPMLPLPRGAAPRPGQGAVRAFGDDSELISEPPPRISPAPPPAGAPVAGRGVDGDLDLGLEAQVDTGDDPDLDHAAVRSARPRAMSRRPPRRDRSRDREGGSGVGRIVGAVLAILIGGGVIGGGAIYGPDLLSPEEEVQDTGPTEPVDIGAAFLEVESTPAGATVLLGNNDLGVTPLRTAVVPGIHTVAVTMDGWQNAAEQVEVGDSEEAAVDVVLVLLDDAPDPERGGRLTIETEPTARLWIAGRWRGETPFDALPVPTGVQDVVFETADGTLIRRRLFIREDDVTSSYINLFEEE